MKRRPPSVQPPSSRISQAVEKRLRGEHAGIGDFEDALHIGQEGHAVLLATPHRVRLQAGASQFRFQFTASICVEAAQGTDFVVD